MNGDQGGRNAVKNKGEASTLFCLLNVNFGVVKSLEGRTGKAFTHVTDPDTASEHPELMHLPLKEFMSDSLVGRHVLVNVSLGYLKKAVARLKSVQTTDASCPTACFLVPECRSFNTCTTDMSLLATFPGAQVYNNPTRVTSSGWTPRLPTRVHLYYYGPPNLPPPPPFCEVRAQVNRGSTLCMQFDVRLGAKLGHAYFHVNALMDTGASHNFMHAKVVEALQLIMMPSPFCSSGLANGDTTPILGQCNIAIDIQGVADSLAVLIIPNMVPGTDIILGNNWAVQNGTVLDHTEQSCTIRSLKRHYKLYARNSPHWRASVVQALTLPPLSVSQADEWIKDGAVAFLMDVGDPTSSSSADMDN